MSKEMIHYARSDTHYLLYIYDRMRNEILKKSTSASENLMILTLERSALTALKKYEKNIYDAETGEGNGGWRKLLIKSTEPLNDENVAVFRAVHAWRDKTGRVEDESTHYVLPNHLLFKISRFMPIVAKDVISGLVPTPPLVRLYSQELAVLIAEALISARSSVAPVAVKAMEETILIPPNPVHTKFSNKKAQEQSIYPIRTPKKESTLSKKSSLFGSLMNETTQKHSFSELAAKIKSEMRLATPVLPIETISVPLLSTVTNDMLEVMEPVPEVNEIKEIKRKVSNEIGGFDHLNEVIPDVSPATKKAKTKKKIADFTAFDYSKAEDPLKNLETEKKSKVFKSSAHADSGVTKKAGKPQNRPRRGNKSMQYQK